MLIFFLLLSLCSSRAEGLHLLPFVDQSESETGLSQVNTGDEIQYQLSRIPENNSANPTINVDESPQPAASARALFLTTFSIRLSAAAPGIDCSRAGIPPRWRDLLTSSTDRSPPLA